MDSAKIVEVLKAQLLLGSGSDSTDGDEKQQAAALLASEIETCINAANASNAQSYGARARTVVINLKNSAILRDRVLSRAVSPHDLATKDLAVLAAPDDQRDKKSAPEDTKRFEKTVHADWAGKCLVSGVGKDVSPLELDIPLVGKEIYLVKKVFSTEECANLLVESEKEDCGFGATNYPKDYRGNLRLTVIDPGLAKAVFERLRPILPQFVVERGIRYEAHGLNEYWRLSKYYAGDRFMAHVDAFFEDSTRKSMFTVNIYMNGGATAFKGGNTAFLFDKDEEGASDGQGDGKRRKIDSLTQQLKSYEVVPEEGLALVFRQPPSSHLLHEGLVVEAGVKYLFRSDVMYRKVA